MSLYLSNTSGDRVKIPMVVAKRLFMMVANVDWVAGTTGRSSQSDHIPESDSAVSRSSVGVIEDVEEGKHDDNSDKGVPLELNDLDYSKEVLETVVHYAMLPDEERTKKIPKPLTVRLKDIAQEHELKLVKNAEQEKRLAQLLDIALYLRFEQLVALCASYASERIEEISREEPDIMTACEKIRNLLELENEWTPEEMENLRKEMEMAKKMDPLIRLNE